MAVGKNKRISKGKKGGKKKVGDPFLKKEWYDIKAPLPFTVRSFGQTLVTKTQGTKIAADGLKGRVFEVSLADLNSDSDDNAFRKMKLCCVDIQGKQCFTDFHGMDFTRDKICSLVKKWHTLIEAFVDVKTSDGYLIRMFCIGFTDRRPDQTKITCYARSSKVRAIRKTMTETMTVEAKKSTLQELIKKFIAESMGKMIQKTCTKIHPLRDVYIRKFKILNKPTNLAQRVAELYQSAGTDTSSTMKRAEGEGAKNLLEPEEE